MEHLRLDRQFCPIISEGITQDIYRYIYVRGRCSLVELFPIFARKEHFLQALEGLLAQRLVTTDLKSIWAREKQVIFSETPLSQPEEASGVLKHLNQQVHVVGEDFTYGGSIHINRDFQLQWFKMSLSPGDRFYLDHFMDFRGRIYPKGHILTYQGTDFQKSLIRCEPYSLEDTNPFAQLRDVTPERMSPQQWMLVDTARSYGLDKNTWSERLQWAQSNVDVMPGAKEPFLYASALKGSQELITDHLVSLDATASGIQCLSLMAQDEESALAVNLGTDEVRNPYQRVKEHMGEYAYQQVKQATMTSFYESVATPQRLFGDDYDKFVNAAQTMLPGPWAMKEAISSCMNYSDQYNWTMMDGFEVKMVVATPIECSMDIGGMDMKWIEHRQAPVGTKGLTANVTHSLDALVLREVLRRTHLNYQWNNNSFSELRMKDIELMQSILRWRVSSFLSVEFLEHMDEFNGALVPIELREKVDALTKDAGMYIQPIHD